MSMIDSTLSSQSHEIAGPACLAALLPLNELFRDSLQRAQAGRGQHRAVTRCEALPLVRGNRQELIQLFDTLTASIFASRPTGSKIFLHIDCERCGPASEDGFGGMQIRFHTNIASDAAWLDAHHRALDSCRDILALHQATFGVKEQQQTGCLFILTIPGKFQQETATCHQ